MWKLAVNVGCLPSVGEKCRPFRDYAGGSMKHRIATIAAAGLLLAGGTTIASTASARDSFSVSIGVPGFAVAYGNRGFYGGYYGGYYAPPPVAYAPAVAYAAYYYDYDAPVAYRAPVVYGPQVVYSRPYYRPYYRPYRAHYWYR